MSSGLKGRVALVGGASKGLGKGCALRLAQEGADLVICSRSASGIGSAADSIRRETGRRVEPVAADLSTPEGVEAVLDAAERAFGRVDILVANSGGPKPGAFFDLDDRDWDEAYRGVLGYVVRLYRGVIPGMIERKWGRLINIASLAVKEPAEGLILSGAFRSGVVSMAKALSRPLIAHNITVNTVCPGAFMTDRAAELISGAAKASGRTAEQVEAEAVQGLPLKRYQTPEELGDLVAFFASEQAKGMTGTVIQLDGGIAKGVF